MTRAGVRPAPSHQQLGIGSPIRIGHGVCSLEERMADSTQRGFLARLNAGVFDLPIDDLDGINAWLDVSRCLTATVFMVVSVGLQQTLLPRLPVGSLIGLALLEILLTIPYRLWRASRRALGALIYTQFIVDIAVLAVGLSLASELPNEFHFLFLLMIVPCALFSPLCGLVMVALASAAHLWLCPELSFSISVALPILVFFLVAQQSRFYGDRLAAKSHEAETSARMAEALLATVRALATEASSGSLLQRVTELARALTASSWACVLVRDPAHGTYRVMGLASRSGKLDEEIKSIAFRAESFDTALARLTLGHCLVVRSAAESPIPPALSARWFIGPFLGAALRRGDDALGMLLVGQDDPATAFHSTTQRLLVGIADQTVLALDNARLVDELRAASTLKSEFISTMSHELRSPLNAIIGYTDLLRDEAAAATDPQAAARDETLAHVRFYALQLLEMIEATLDVSRLEAGRLPLHDVPTDLGTFMGEVRAGIPEYWCKPAVALEWSISEDLPVIELDAPKLATVVRNLVHNALKFTERGRVDVRARLELAHPTTSGDAGYRLAVRVSDTGVGIPREQLGVVFEMFRQADGSDSRRHGGVGLGLYIVTRLTQALGGDVRVESTLGKGSVFTVTVPVHVVGAEHAARATG
jgi:signal transduction histidine kinase